MNKIKRISTIKTFIVVFLVTYINIISLAQNSINIKIDESDMNTMISILKTSRGFNFGNYEVLKTYVNMQDAEVDIEPNNRIRLYNIDFRAVGNIVLGWEYLNIDFDVVEHAYGWIEFLIEITGSSNDGFKLNAQPLECYFDLEGDLPSWFEGFAEDMINDVSNIPDIDLYLGYSVLPDKIEEYFESGIPILSTNENEIILTFNVLMEDLTFQNKIVNTGESETHYAKNAINLKQGFHAKKGCHFKGAIHPNFKSAEYCKPILFSFIEQENNNIENDDLAAQKILDIKEEIVKGLIIYPNPTSGNLTIEQTGYVYEPINIEIRDMTGNLIYKAIYQTNRADIDITDNPNGIYLVKIIQGNNVNTYKIIKE